VNGVRASKSGAADVGELCRNIMHKKRPNSVNLNMNLKQLVCQCALKNLFFPNLLLQKELENFTQFLIFLDEQKCVSFCPKQGI
jgi:hypothetical protein